MFVIRLYTSTDLRELLQKHYKDDDYILILKSNTIDV